MLCLIGCEGNNMDDSKFNIVTSFYPMYLATSNITEGAEGVTLSNLTEVSTGCLHDYQITTADMLKLSHADVLVINGGGMESFIEKAISTYPSLSIINSSIGLKESHPQLIVDDEFEHHDDEENSHYWVSISLFIEQVRNIKDELCELDPQNSQIYEKNADNYIAKLEDLRNKMHDVIDIAKNKNIVTFHEAFLYFAKEFDLNVVDVIQREPGTYPSAKEVAEIIKNIKDKDVSAIFVEPQYSRTAADTISKETGVLVYELDPIVTGQLEKDAYIETMEKNLEVLKQALR